VLRLKRIFKLWSAEDAKLLCTTNCNAYFACGHTSVTGPQLRNPPPQQNFTPKFVYLIMFDAFCFPLKYLYPFMQVCLGLSIKDVRNHGRYVQCGHFADKGKRFFRCGWPPFLVEKISDFRNLWSARMDKRRRIEPVLTFCGREEGQFFAILCKRLFWTTSTAL